MDQDDPEKRIGELERQLSEQYRVAEPERQQNDAENSSARSAAPVSGPTLPDGTDSVESSAAVHGLGPGAISFTRWQRRRPLRSLRLVWFVAALWAVLIPIGHGVSLLMSHSTTNSLNLPTLTVTRGGVMSEGGSSQFGTIVCNDGTVKLSGDHNNFTVTGHCLSLDVTGSDVHVLVDSADTIDAGGDGTFIVYHSGTPHVIKSGTNVFVGKS